MEIGTIVLAKYFNGVANPEESQKYQQTLIQNFDTIGMFAFGQMPFFTQNGPNPEIDYDWQNIDAVINFANSNGLKIHYNTVINHRESVPEWFHALSSVEKVTAFERHIRAVIRRYKGKVSAYKLVNEAYHVEEEEFLGTNLNRVNLITKMFQWAKDEDPEGVYMLNDHVPFLAEDNDRRPKYLDLIKRLKDNGAPIDVIGIQGHLGYRPIPFQLPSDEDIHTTLNEVHNAAQLPIYITEFELSYRNCKHNQHFPGCEIDPKQKFITKDGKEFSNWFEYQALAYKHFYDLLTKKEYIKGLLFWGYYDKDYSDNLNERPGVGFFDEKFNPKPVYNTFKDILCH